MMHLTSKHYIVHCIVLCNEYYYHQTYKVNPFVVFFLLRGEKKANYPLASGVGKHIGHLVTGGITLKCMGKGASLVMLTGVGMRGGSDAMLGGMGKGASLVVLMGVGMRGGSNAMLGGMGKGASLVVLMGVGMRGDSNAMLEGMEGCHPGRSHGCVHERRL